MSKNKAPDNINITQGILPSEAALVLESSFRSVLGLNNAQLVNLSPTDKLSKYCTQPQLSAIRDYIRDDAVGGLPSMTPPRTILKIALSDVGLASTVQLLWQRVTDYAYYVLVIGILGITFASVTNAQWARVRRSDNRVEVDIGRPLSEVRIDKIYMIDGSDGPKVYSNFVGNGGGLAGHLIVFTAQNESITANLETSPVQIAVMFTDLAKNKKGFVTIGLKEIDFATTLPKMRESLQSVRAESEGKDDAELYMAGSVTTAIGSSPNWVGDLKYERQFFFEKFPFAVAPFAKLSYDSKADETDRLSLGIKFSKGFSFSLPDTRIDNKSVADTEYAVLTSDRSNIKNMAEFRRLERTWSERQYFDYSGSLEFESDWDFKVNNLITSQELKYLFKPKFNRALTARAAFTSFIGAELGANLRNPLLSGKKAIARIKAGATLTLKKEQPFGAIDWIKDVTWESNFVQRWFLKDEFAFDKDDDGNLLFKEFGRRPRSHFKSELAFKFNDYFGPAISYEWGQEPPLYTKVRHKMNFKLVYSFSRKTNL